MGGRGRHESAGWCCAEHNGDRDRNYAVTVQSVRGPCGGQELAPQEAHARSRDHPEVNFQGGTEHEARRLTWATVEKLLTSACRHNHFGERCRRPVYRRSQIKESWTPTRRGHSSTTPRRGAPTRLRCRPGHGDQAFQDSGSEVDGTRIIIKLDGGPALALCPDLLQRQ